MIVEKKIVENNKLTQCIFELAMQYMLLLSQKQIAKIETN